MSGKKRTFSKEFKQQVLVEADAGVSVAELSHRCPSCSYGVWSSYGDECKFIVNAWEAPAYWS